MLLHRSLPLLYLADNETNIVLPHCFCIVNITQLDHNWSVKLARTCWDQSCADIWRMRGSDGAGGLITCVKEQLCPRVYLNVEQEICVSLITQGFTQLDIMFTLTMSLSSLSLFSF